MESENVNKTPHSRKKPSQQMKRRSLPFKSPLHKITNSDTPKESSERVNINELKQKLFNFEQEIAELKDSGYREEELQHHMTKMHEYNEIKDIGQMVLGRIADIEGIRTKDLYEVYGLDVND